MENIDFLRDALKQFQADHDFDDSITFDDWLPDYLEQVFDLPLEGLVPYVTARALRVYSRNEGVIMNLSGASNITRFYRRVAILYYGGLLRQNEPFFARIEHTRRKANRG